MFHTHRVPVRHHLRAGENVIELQFDSALEYIATHNTEFTAPRGFNEPTGTPPRIR